MKVHHIGYAVKNIDKAYKEFEKIGFNKINDVVRDTIRKVDILFICNENNSVIELISPYEVGSDVDGVLKKWGGSSPYHLCFLVSDIDEYIKNLDRTNVVIRKPEIAPAINNKRVAFLYNKDFGLFEVVEE